MSRRPDRVGREESPEATRPRECSADAQGDPIRLRGHGFYLHGRGHKSRSGQRVVDRQDNRRLGVLALPGER
jgi:hypothetical protein